MLMMPSIYHRPGDDGPRGKTPARKMMVLGSARAQVTSSRFACKNDEKPSGHTKAVCESHIRRKPFHQIHFLYSQIQIETQRWNANFFSPSSFYWIFVFDRFRGCLMRAPRIRYHQPTSLIVQTGETEGASFNTKIVGFVFHAFPSNHSPKFPDFRGILQQEILCVMQDLIWARDVWPICLASSGLCFSSRNHLLSKECWALSPHNLIHTFATNGLSRKPFVHPPFDDLLCLDTSSHRTYGSNHNRKRLLINSTGRSFCNPEF